MIPEIAEIIEAAIQSPTPWFRLNRWRLSRANTVRTIISSHVWKLLLVVVEFLNFHVFWPTIQTAKAS
jgi:hypothetical protein